MDILHVSRTHTRIGLHSLRSPDPDKFFRGYTPESVKVNFEMTPPEPTYTTPDCGGEVRRLYAVEDAGDGTPRQGVFDAVDRYEVSNVGTDRILILAYLNK